MAPPVLDVVVPVLWRPERVRRVASSISSSTLSSHRLTFLADADDLETRRELVEAGLRFLIAPPVPRWGRATYGSKVNLAYRELDAPYLAVLADDVVPEPGWDLEALDAFARWPDAGVVATNDQLNLRTIVGITATHPVIRRAYVEEHAGATADGVDPVFSEAYRHNYVDGELVAIARSRGAFRAALRSIVRHEHYQNGAPDDRTYQEARRHLARDRETQGARLRAFDPTKRGDPRARGRRILLTNRALDRVGGSESALVALLAELRRRGAVVDVWTPRLGALGRRIGALEHLRGLRFEVAFANHANTIASAKRHAERVIQTCHGTIPQAEQPHELADELVAVSEEVRAHVLEAAGRSATLIRNGIDPVRYRPRRAPSAYPEVPELVRLVSNYTGGRLVAARAVEIASARAGRRIRFEHVRHARDTAPLMSEADVVFGLGRTALEAIASGAHAVVWDARSYQDALGDGPIEPGSPAYARALYANFSGRGLRLRPSPDELATWLLEHSPRGRIALRELALSDHSIVDTATAYLAL